MKTVGLLTFTSDNYGACLQACAVRKKLENLGFIVKFINYRCVANGHQNRGVLQYIKKIRNLFDIQLFKRLKVRKIIQQRSNKFDCFRKQYIYTDCDIYSNVDQLSELSRELDAVVCGSDMIWSAEFSDILDVYLLTWCGSTPRISYAPSFGSINMAARIKNRYMNALSKFNAISCREKSGSGFIGSILNKNVTTVCDPTLLFDAELWQEWFPSQNTCSEPFLLTYCFGGIPKAMQKEVDKICKDRGWTQRSILGKCYDETLRELDFGDGAYGPIEFIELFSKANFIIVNGYHGLLFALIFNKPFVLLHRECGEHWSMHEERMSDLLDQLGLQDRYISPDACIDIKHLSLDYKGINRTIAQMRAESETYLKNALSNI